jgi:hypothetical protein
MINWNGIERLQVLPWDLSGGTEKTTKKKPSGGIAGVLAKI